jgi:hypothetical protein
MQAPKTTLRAALARARETPSVMDDTQWLACPASLATGALGDRIDYAAPDRNHRVRAQWF